MTDRLPKSASATVRAPLALTVMADDDYRLYKPFRQAKKNHLPVTVKMIANHGYHIPPIGLFASFNDPSLTSLCTKALHTVDLTEVPRIRN